MSGKYFLLFMPQNWEFSCPYIPGIAGPVILRKIGATVRLWQLCSRGRKFLSTKKAGLSTLYYLDIDDYPH